MISSPNSWFRKISEQSGFANYFDFSHRHSFAGKIKIVFLAWGVQLIWNCAMLFFVKNFMLVGKTYGEIATVAFGNPFIGAKLLSTIGIPLRAVATGTAILALSTFVNFLFSCVSAPAWEEAVFRRLPINLAQVLERISNASDKIQGIERQKIPIVVPLIFVSSIIFGILHGSVLNILFQGFGGLTLSYVYVKCNNSYWSSFFSHALWNFSLIFLLPILFSS